MVRVIIMQSMIIEPVPNIIDPFNVFQKISCRPYPFILENTVSAFFRKEKEIPLSMPNRFSIVGCDPLIIIKAQQDEVEITDGNNKRKVKGEPFLVLDSILSNYKRGFSEIPSGVCVGYLGYDLKNMVEDLPPKKEDTLVLPDMIMGVYDTLFVYDHYVRKGYIVSPDEREEGFKRYIEIIKSPLSVIGSDFKSASNAGKKKLFSSNFTRDEYLDAVKKAKGHIREGDIYQINISQRFSMPFAYDTKNLYSRLRRGHPVEFSAFFDYGDFQVISNSPECFLKISSGIIETYPIKGTRPRGKDYLEDEEIIRELKTNIKELAEHIMIVDLERNDLGRVCVTGTVKVKELERIVTYPTLHHLVSCVTGKIKNEVAPIECIKACFPGGSVTGAPKIKAMEIIEKLEPTPRGIYTGAIGYIDFSGNVNLGMAIRTSVFSRGRMFLNVGSGIVADSVPEDEYEETILKAEAFFRAI